MRKPRRVFSLEVFRNGGLGDHRMTIARPRDCCCVAALRARAGEPRVPHACSWTSAADQPTGDFAPFTDSLRLRLRGIGALPGKWVREWYGGGRGTTALMPGRCLELLSYTTDLVPTQSMGVSTFIQPYSQHVPAAILPSYPRPHQPTPPTSQLGQPPA
eukprot:scaffold34945_cov112-Isochrysis_galbana.AAC.2